jgi:Tannase and feruloyl esterase
MSSSLGERSKKHRLATVTAILLSTVSLGPVLLATPASAKQAPKPMNCSALAAFVRQQAGKQLNTNPIAPAGTTISSATPVTAAIIPASGSTLAYCQVVFQLEPAITIEVGLPLSALDGGTGGATGGCGVSTVTNNSCVEGNWNGKIEVIGNGGYAGNVAGVTGATNEGFVGSGTDNGHSTNWCNAIDPETGVPNSQANCGIAGGGFLLDPKNNLSKTQVTDFIDTSEVDQTIWATTLTQAYYGQQAHRTYWNGCSTGGRQGFEMAQFHPELFDGILAGAPAFNWNRFIIGEMWPPVVVADVDPADCSGGTAAGCANGLSTTFVNAYTAANTAAVAACDGNDGVLNGVVNEPRECFYDARSLIGQTPPPMTSPMTEAQAQAIGMIWDGPRNQRGQRLWGGITRGTSFATLTGPFSSSLITTYVYNWMEQNPNFNIIANINTTNFSTYFQMSDRKFADTVPPPPGFVVPAATDSIDLESLIKHGTKLIHYRGTNDPLIVPFGSWNYDTRLFEKYGVAGTQSFYRSFYYPGNGHCGGNGGFPNAGLINSSDLFNDLIAWVENGTAPNSVVAYTGPKDTGNTALICAAPNKTIYQGGPITSASSYSCTDYRRQPPDLAAYDQTAVQYHEAP